jgi:hypothetical protein
MRRYIIEREIPGVGGLKRPILGVCGGRFDAFWVLV